MYPKWSICLYEKLWLSDISLTVSSWSFIDFVGKLSWMSLPIVTADEASASAVPLCRQIAVTINATKKVYPVPLWAFKKKICPVPSFKTLMSIVCIFVFRLNSGPCLLTYSLNTSESYWCSRSNSWLKVLCIERLVDVKANWSGSLYNVIKDMSSLLRCELLIRTWCVMRNIFR